MSVKGTAEKKNIEDSAFRTFCQGKFTLQRSHQDYKTTVYSPEEQNRHYNSPGRDTAIWWNREKEERTETTTEEKMADKEERVDTKKREPNTYCTFFCFCIYRVGVCITF